MLSKAPEVVAAIWEAPPTDLAPTASSPPYPWSICHRSWMSDSGKCGDSGALE
ncbi:hypothetical protein M2281_005107 [Mesorhizobium soli]|nr:hypothetical protein [Mesorhizobium soli]